MKLILRADLGAGLGGAGVAGEGWGEESDDKMISTKVRGYTWKIADRRVKMLT